MEVDANRARLLILRHGQSAWNAEQRWQGDLDPPLSPLGVRQGRAAAAVLGSFDLVVSSPLDRAHTTASLIADDLGVGPVHVEDDLRERHAGGFQGLTRDEIEDRYPGYRAAGRHPPGWEDDDALLTRTTAALGRIGMLAAGGTALVISHGGVIRCLESVLGATRDASVPNLGGRWFEVGPRTLRPGDVVDLLGDDLRTVPTQL